MNGNGELNQFYKKSYTYYRYAAEIFFCLEQYSALVVSLKYPHLITCNSDDFTRARSPHTSIKNT